VIAAAAVLVHKLTGAGDLILGLPVTGRMGEEQRAVPAMTTNTLPVRVTADRGTSVRDLLRQAAARSSSALRHRRYPHEDILRDLRLAGGGALFGLVVNVMASDSAIRFRPVPVVARNISNGPISDLEISVYDRSAEAGISMSFDGNPDLYDEASCAALARRFRRVLTWLATAAPGDAVSRVEVLPEAERCLMLEEWNDTECDFPSATLPELVAAQAGRTPDAIAVTGGDSCRSCRELNDRASRLARRLALPGPFPLRAVSPPSCAGP
jgi:nonribosomal peptide synthetase DhbF